MSANSENIDGPPIIILSNRHKHRELLIAHHEIVVLPSHTGVKHMVNYM